MTVEREWKPIETQPYDGRQVEFLMPAGIFEGPSAKPPNKPISRKDRFKLFKEAGWPDPQFIPTHWREIVNSEHE